MPCRGGCPDAISRFDAELHTAQYNRALLRRTVDETASRMGRTSEASTARALTLRIYPVVSPAFAGVTGTF